MLKCILVVEDDEVDFMGFNRVMSKLPCDVEVVRAVDGVEALEVLESEAQVEEPFIIILDMNMPRMNGLEFLKELRSTDKYSNAIVYVLTTSNYDKDKIEADKYCVSGFFNKKDFYSMNTDNNPGLAELFKKLKLRD